MKILLINLDSATQRLAFQRQQLAGLDLPFERLAAVRIEDESDPLYAKYADSWERKLSMAEVSCFLSHRQAWQKVVTANQPALILEDDALLAEDLPALLDEIACLAGVDYLKLEGRGLNKKKLLAKQTSFSLHKAEVFRLYQGRSGAAGYVIWPQGAEKLLAKMQQEGIALADKFINSCYQLLAFHLEPAPIIQLDQCPIHGLDSPLSVSSSIGARPPVTDSVVSKMFWIFRGRRIAGQLKILLNQLHYGLVAKRREIAISQQFPRTNKPSKDPQK